MPVLNAPERGARWHATHDVIAEAGSKAVELLKRIEQTHDMHSSVMGQFSDQRANANAQADAAWEKRSAERRSIMEENAKRREELWAAKAREEEELKKKRDEYTREVALRHKRAMLTMQIEMMRRDAEHNKHMVGVTGDIHMGTGADTGIEAARAEQWVQISELPSYRLVLLVFETIDVDGSRSLDKDEILGSAFGKKLEPHLESLDPNGDGDIDLGEWLAWFEELAETLQGDYGMFLVDLVWQSEMKTSHLITNEQAACMIQARHRGNAWRWEKKQLVETATMIQTAWRGKLARNRRDVLVNIRAGLRIQSWMRARRARLELQDSDPQLAAKLKDCRGNVEAPPRAKQLFEEAGDMLMREQRRGVPMSEEDAEYMVKLYLEAAKEGYPRKGRCYNGAGMGLCKLGRLKDAYEIFTRAIGEDLHDARSWHNRAKCAYDLGNLRQAHQDAMRARRESSEFPEAQQQSGRALGSSSFSASRRSVSSQPRPLTGARSSRPGTGVSFAPSSIAEEDPLESEDTRKLWEASGQPGVQENPKEWLKARNLPKETSAQKKARRAGNEIAEKNLVTVSTLLQQSGADVNFAQKGLTCLGRAAVAGNAKVVSMLLINGAELEGAAHQRRYKTCGYTPLMLAAQHGHVEAMRRLLAAGTDLEASTATTVKGREETVWTVAERDGTEEVKAMLDEVVGPPGYPWKSSTNAAAAATAAAGLLVGTPHPPSSDRPTATTPRAGATLAAAAARSDTAAGAGGAEGGGGGSGGGDGGGEDSARLSSARAALRARTLSSAQQPAADAAASEMAASVAQMVAMRKENMRQIAEGGMSVVAYAGGVQQTPDGAQRAADAAAAGGGGVRLPAIPSAQPVG